MKRLLLILLLLPALTLRAEWLPDKPARLVNDYSGMLGSSEAEALEQRLVAFNDSTSNQIVIVITPTIEGDDEQAAAQRVGEAWGVGQDEFDNGLVILIKSKTEEEDWGAVALATGYGVEGALPDVYCKRIIDDKMLGPLGDGDYYRALTAALDIIEPAMRGEYDYAQYRKDERRAELLALLCIVSFFAVIFLLMYRSYKKHPEQWTSGGGGGGGFYGGSSSGLWGGGSSHGGGFGGFGGGSFGGGGASGRF